MQASEKSRYSTVLCFDVCIALLTRNPTVPWVTLPDSCSAASSILRACHVPVGHDRSDDASPSRGNMPVGSECRECRLHAPGGEGGNLVRCFL